MNSEPVTSGPSPWETRTAGPFTKMTAVQVDTVETVTASAAEETDEMAAVSVAGPTPAAVIEAVTVEAIASVAAAAMTALEARTAVAAQVSAAAPEAGGSP